MNSRQANPHALRHEGGSPRSHAEPPKYWFEGRLLRRFAGRFFALRVLYAWCCRTFFAAKPKHSVGPTCFPATATDAVVAQLRKTGLYTGFNLPAAVNSKIFEFAQTNECNGGFGDPEARKRTFHHTQVEKAERESGIKFLIATYPRAADRCDTVAQLLQDSVIRNIASSYLGAEPSQAYAMLWWSFACEASAETRLASSQTVLFHYDEFAIRFLYFNFYITSVDAKAGPHVCVETSHLKKSLRQKLGKSSRTDTEIERFYGQEKIRSLVGPPGYGFIEDSTCFHKATAPEKTHRLFLQLRFGIGGTAVYE